MAEQLTEAISLFEFIKTTAQFKKAATDINVENVRIKMLVKMDWSSTHSCYASDARVVNRLQVNDTDLTSESAVSKNLRRSLPDKWKVGRDAVLKEGDIGPQGSKYSPGDTYTFMDGGKKKGMDTITHELG